MIFNIISILYFKLPNKIGNTGRCWWLERNELGKHQSVKSSLVTHVRFPFIISITPLHSPPSLPPSSSFILIFLLIVIIHFLTRVFINITPAGKQTKFISKITGSPSTDGIAVYPPLELSDGVTISLWDFGGQEIFYPTHQLFLSSDSIYIFVFNFKKFNKSRINYWVKLINDIGGKSSKKVRFWFPPLFLILFLLFLLLFLPFSQLSS